VIGGPDPGGQAGLHRDRRQRVTQQVGQVAGDPEALLLRRQGRKLGTRLGQRVGTHDATVVMAAIRLCGCRHGGHRA
jgi:hypothetical protein